MKSFCFAGAVSPELAAPWAPNYKEGSQKLRIESLNQRCTSKHSHVSKGYSTHLSLKVGQFTPTLSGFDISNDATLIIENRLV